MCAPKPGIAIITCFGGVTFFLPRRGFLITVKLTMAIKCVMDVLRIWLLVAF